MYRLQSIVHVCGEIFVKNEAATAAAVTTNLLAPA